MIETFAFGPVEGPEWEQPHPEHRDEDNPPTVEEVVRARAEEMNESGARVYEFKTRDVGPFQESGPPVIDAGRR